MKILDRLKDWWENNYGFQSKLKRLEEDCDLCNHPGHYPGKCEALDGGWNPAGYCWCPNDRSPVERSTGQEMYFP